MRAPDLDVVVVGSGFGGSVMALKLQEHGRSVCVLERGRRHSPLDFPRSPREIHDSLWRPDRGRHGMFEARSFAKLDSIVASGLGGGSLIYANVLLRKPEGWFVENDPERKDWSWPITYADLEPHYAEVERRIGIAAFPFRYDPYSGTRKTLAYRDAARKVGLPWETPPLAVSFGNDPAHPRVGECLRASANLHDAPRYSCRLCGECDFGCRYGSKNTLDLTLLSQAVAAGATVRTDAEVRGLEALDERGRCGWSVRYRDHREGMNRELTCQTLVLAAGAFGTTELLLRARRDALGHLSPALGRRFSGNGDFLGFVHRSRRRLDPAGGPAITSAVRGEDFYIEEGGFPEFIAWLVQFLVPGGPMALRGGIDLAALLELLGDGSRADGTMPLLGMGREHATARLSLGSEDALETDWTPARSKSYYERIEKTMQLLAGAMEACFIPYPLAFLRRGVTVHPLGGCPMGRNPEEGVVDSTGKVFGYENLVVADGSVLPGTAGPNPALTIAAVAHLFADAL